MSAPHDGAAVRLPPPLVYLFGVIAGVLLHVYVHPLPLGLSPGVRIAASAVLFAAGLALGIGAIAHFRRTGQSPAPWTSTPAIIARGSYRLTRNPMYVGMTLFQASFAFAAANGWILALIPLVVLVVQVTAIRHEEAYLERKFGSTYLDYKKRVRRWI